MGGGVGLNDYDIETYPIHPVEIHERPSLLLSGYIGVEKPLYKNLYLFSEIMRIWEKQRIEVQGLEPGTSPENQSGRMTEDISRTEVTFGVGVKF